MRYRQIMRVSERGIRQCLVDAASVWSRRRPVTGARYRNHELVARDGGAGSDSYRTLNRWRKGGLHWAYQKGPLCSPNSEMEEL